MISPYFIQGFREKIAQEFSKGSPFFNLSKPQQNLLTGLKPQDGVLVNLTDDLRKKLKENFEQHEGARDFTSKTLKDWGYKGF